jgi:hypothetical protein
MRRAEVWRIGTASARRAPVDEVARVLKLFETRYFDFTVKHFHEKLVDEHGIRRSYTKNALRRARRPNAGVSIGGASRHDGAPGRLAARVGGGPVVGPDRHHG